MIKNEYPGKKIDFEGIDGSGKSGQIELAKPYVAANWPTAIFTKEPYTRRADGTPVASGLSIYEILQGRHPHLRVSDLALDAFQLEHYIPNRLEHYREVVVPALERGAHVLSDRGPASTAYGAVSPLSLDLLICQQNLAFLRADLRPIWSDAILIYDVPVNVAMARLQESGKILDDHEQWAVLSRVQDRYLELAKREPNCHVIDGTRHPEEVFQDTKAILDRVFGRP